LKLLELAVTQCYVSQLADGLLQEGKGSLAATGSYLLQNKGSLAEAYLAGSYRPATYT